MRAPRRAISLTPFLVAMLAACVAEDDAVRVKIAPSLVFPHGVLDAVTALEVSVYDQTASIGCDAATGVATGITSDTARVANAQLGTSGCANGARFCGQLTLSKSETMRVFSAQAKDTARNVVANGCAIAQVNEDSLSLPIKMVRFVPPSVCGNGKVDPTEQCEPGASDCDAQCHTKEQRLTDPTAVVANPFFLWPAQSGEPQGRFFGFFTQTFNGTNLDVAMRLLSDTFGRVSGPTAAQDHSIIVPNTPGGSFPPSPAANDQSLPAAASVGGTYFVAFRDTDNGTPDVHLRSFDTSLDALDANAIPINGGAAGASGEGEAGIQTAPSIAAGNGVLFVAWQDETGPSQGQVLGRTYTPGTGVATQNQLSTGTQNKNVKVASSAGGWFAVWESGNDVKLRAIGANGTPSGAEQIVNEANVHRGAQDHPSIAVLGDGRICVAWADRGAAGGSEIFVQRYDKDLNKVAGDQAIAINDVVSAGDQLSPVVAATAAAGGSFVVAWVDTGSKQIRARLLGGSGGFLFNNVDGQSSEFQASLAASHTRVSPTIAVGGAAPSIAIGWEDQTSGAAGIYGRRFPAPTQ